jgi:hypothetical protein
MSEFDKGVILLGYDIDIFDQSPNRKMSKNTLVKLQNSALLLKKFKILQIQNPAILIKAPNPSLIILHSRKPPPAKYIPRLIHNLTILQDRHPMQKPTSHPHRAASLCEMQAEVGMVGLEEVCPGEADVFLGLAAG